MSDPFEQLRQRVEAVPPTPAYARRLRRRLVGDLGLDPETSDRPTDPTGRTLVTATALHPYVTVHDAAAAIDFYGAAFGATETFRVVGDDGRVGHADLAIGPLRIMLSDEYPEIDVRAPATLGGTAVTLYLVVDDCDAAHDAAVAAGATSVRAPADQDHGNRTATILDPFGHRWMLSQAIEELDLDTYAARQTGEFRVEPAAEPED